jgi:NADH dehydrogenase
MSARPRVVVVGAGFGGLAVARGLARAPVDVLVVDRHNYHAFLPLLYQVATSGLTTQDIAFPVRGVLRRIRNARFQMGHVVRADLAARWIETRDGARIPFDVLVLAPGSATETYGNASAERFALGLHDPEEALAVRNRVLACLERADATDDAALRETLTGFVVVGGGPTGLELAGALAELRRHVVPRDFPRLGHSMRVVLLEGREHLLGAFPERLRRAALRQVEALGVEVRLRALVDRVEPGAVWLRGGERIAARTVIWAAGVRGAPLAAALGLAGPAGRVPVSPALEVAGHDSVYAIGDVARVEGDAALPQVAPVAIQQGELVARNVLRRLRGHPPFPFVYRDRGAMATIGRNHAVANVFGWPLSGRLAWWAWLLVHLVYLVGVRNRVSVLVNWAYNYVTYDRGLRALVGVDDVGAAAPDQDAPSSSGSAATDGSIRSSGTPAARNAGASSCPVSTATNDTPAPAAARASITRSPT